MNKNKVEDATQKTIYFVFLTKEYILPQVVGPVPVFAASSQATIANNKIVALGELIPYNPPYGSPLAEVLHFYSEDGAKLMVDGLCWASFELQNWLCRFFQPDADNQIGAPVPYRDSFAIKSRYPGRFFAKLWHSDDELTPTQITLLKINASVVVEEARGLDCLKFQTVPDDNLFTSLSELPFSANARDDFETHEQMFLGDLVTFKESYTSPEIWVEVNDCLAKYGYRDHFRRYLPWWRGLNWYALAAEQMSQA